MQTLTRTDRLEVAFVVKNVNNKSSILVARNNGEGDFIVALCSGYQAFAFKKQWNRLMYRINQEDWMASEAGTCLVSIPDSIPVSCLQEVVEQFLAADKRETHFSLSDYVERDDYDACDEDWIY